MDEGMRFEEVVSLIISDDPRYELKAYAFVYNVIGDLHAAMDVKRHLTGREVLDGLRIRATDKFGPMAKEVLNTWGIATTIDVGNIVFNLVEAGLLEKTDRDRIEDFQDVFDFREVFEEDYFKS